MSRDSDSDVRLSYPDHDVEDSSVVKYSNRSDFVDIEVESEHVDCIPVEGEWAVISDSGELVISGVVDETHEWMHSFGLRVVEDA